MEGKARNTFDETHVIHTEDVVAQPVIELRDRAEVEDGIRRPKKGNRVGVRFIWVSHLLIGRDATWETRQARYTNVNRCFEAPARFSGIAGLGGNGMPARRHGRHPQIKQRVDLSAYIRDRVGDDEDIEGCLSGYGRPRDYRGDYAEIPGGVSPLIVISKRQFCKVPLL